MSKILGIDLGTTNSAMAAVIGGEPKIIENAEGNRTTPSVAGVSKSGERLVGLLAKRQAVTNPKNTIFSVKRLIGRKFSDSEVEHDKELFSYDMQEAKGGGIEIKMGDSSTSGVQAKWYKPEEISAMVLAKLKADAEAHLGEKIEEAVITVPAYFDDAERQATKNAGEIAGLKVRRILNEPTAAALAYGFGTEKSRRPHPKAPNEGVGIPTGTSGKNEKIVVFDFGGGTFDISVLEVGDDTVEVRATGGDTHLGGDDFDRRINDHLIAEYKKQEGIDLGKDPLALQRLKEAAEKAKHELSAATETEINLPYVSSDSSGPKHLLMKLTRAKLEELTRDLIEKSVKLVEETVTASVPKGAGYKLADIDEIILVGGQTRMPAMAAAVKKLFGKEPHKGINPDEVVAMGAAIQAGILQGDVRDILLLDVTPLTLSIETLGGVSTPMIQKNTTVPTAKTQTFSTAADNQPSVEIHVLQGERPMAADNKTLARFILDGIPPSPRGTPQVEVSFDIDANGILNVSAKDKATGKGQSVKIEATTALSKEEVERLKADAAAHAEEDRKKKELIEARNQAESLMYAAEKAVRDAGDKVSAEIKTAVEEKIARIKEVKDGEDASAIQGVTKELSDELQKIGSAMYNKKEDKGDEKENNGNQDQR